MSAKVAEVGPEEGEVGVWARQWRCGERAGERITSAQFMGIFRERANDRECGESIGTHSHCDNGCDRQSDCELDGVVPARELAGSTL